MTNYEIEQLYNGLEELRGSVSETLPSSIAFPLIRNLRKLAPIVEDYHEVRNSIIVANGTEDKEKPGSYSIAPEKIEDVNKELIALANTEINDLDLSQINYESLDGLNLTLAQMDALYPMIKGEA